MLMAVCPAGAQTVLQFALPTPEAHPRNQALMRWADAVAARSKRQLIVALTHGVTDYEGARIPAAVAEGVYDMAAPGWWHMSRYVPDFGLPSLPMFYGQDRDTMRQLFDSAFGEELNDKLEAALRVRVIGRPLDLGFGQIYVAGKAVKTYEDLQGRNIRVPGGGADLARYLVFGATPRRISVRDLADALRRNLIGGLLATHNFVADAALWEVGIRHAFLDNQVFYQYTPIINRTRWEALFDEERAWLTETWEVTIDAMRLMAAERQARSRALAMQNGVTFIEASEEQRKTMRDRLLEEQPAVAAALNIDPKAVERARATLTQRGKPK